MYLENVNSIINLANDYNYSYVVIDNLVLVQDPNDKNIYSIDLKQVEQDLSIHYNISTHIKDFKTLNLIQRYGIAKGLNNIKSFKTIYMQYILETNLTKLN
jgi:hypothetical protein